MTKVLDFTAGNMWGHALHAHTFSQIKPNPLTRACDWYKGQVRASFMVHYPLYPKVGDVVRWKSNRGVSEGVIYDTKRAQGVADMWTLYVTVDQKVEK